MSLPADLHTLSDAVLLERSRPLPLENTERKAICEVLVTRYTGLVRSVVRRYRLSPEPAEDLLQAGFVGLLKAINNFDPGVGESLAAYAQSCISGEIKRHFRDRRWQIRIRRPAQDLLLELRAAEEALAQQLGRTPNDAELARHLGVREDDIRQARQASLARVAYSLDAPLPGEDPGTLADVLGQEDPAVAHTTDMEAVRAHLDALPERQHRILMLHFYGNLTQAQIAARLGISQMHVSRQLNQALAYLRTQITQTA